MQGAQGARQACKGKGERERSYFDEGACGMLDSSVFSIGQFTYLYLYTYESIRSIQQACGHHAGKSQHVLAVVFREVP